MSDWSNGPGWWQASDGKWYPPETHPDYQAAVAAPPAPPSPNASPSVPLVAPTLPPAQPPTAPFAPPQPAAHSSVAAISPAPRKKKRRFTRWLAAAVVLLIGIAVISAIAAPPEEEAETDGARPEPAATSETGLPVDGESAPVSTVAPVEAAPDDDPVQPDEEFELTADDIRDLVFPIVFESTREDVIALMSDLVIVQSVDVYDYDSTNGIVRVDITPTFDFDSGVRDDAWDIMRAMAVMWTEEAWLETDTGWSPALQMTITTAQYQCNGEQMQAMVDARFSRSDWEANCRIR